MFLSLANASHNVVLRDVSMRIIEINDIRTLHEFLPIELAVATGQARDRIYVAPQEIVMFEVGHQSMTGGKAQDFTFISGLIFNARPLWFSVAAVTAETAAFACFEVVFDEQGFAHLEERDKEWRQ